MASTPAEAQLPPASRKRWWIGVLKVLATLLVTWLILDRMGVGVSALREMDPAFWRPAPMPFLLSAGVLLTGYGLSSLAWSRMVSELGGVRLPPMAAFRVYFTANLGRYIPGKVWQLAGMALLSRGVGVAPALALGAAILAQVVSLLAAGLLGGLLLLAGTNPWEGAALVAVAGGVFLLGFLSLPPIFRLGVGWIFRRAGGTIPPGLVEDHWFLLRWTLLHLGIWVVYGLAFWLLALSLGLHTSPILLGAAFAAAYVAGYMVLFAPAGLGVREGVLVVFLEPALGGGAALGLSLLARVWSTGVEAVPGALAGWATLRGGGASGERD